RADVQAEAGAALKAGQIQYGEVTRIADASAAQPKDRAEVIAEARDALRHGQSSRGEVDAYPPVPSQLGRMTGSPVIDTTPTKAPAAPAAQLGRTTGPVGQVQRDAGATTDGPSAVAEELER